MAKNYAASLYEKVRNAHPEYSQKKVYNTVNGILAKQNAARKAKVQTEA